MSNNNISVDLQYLKPVNCMQMDEYCETVLLLFICNTWNHWTVWKRTSDVEQNYECWIAKRKINELYVNLWVMSNSIISVDLQYLNHCTLCKRTRDVEQNYECLIAKRKINKLYVNKWVMSKSIISVDLQDLKPLNCMQTNERCRTELWVVNCKT